MHTLLVYITSLLSIKMIISHYLPDNVMLIEWPNPPLRYLVLYLVFDQVLVRALRQRSLHRLFMKLIKFVIEASYHILDLSTFLFSLQSFNHGCLYLLR